VPLAEVDTQYLVACQRLYMNFNWLAPARAAVTNATVSQAIEVE